MRIINIINMKGGVGKTMTAVEMGYILHHRYGYKVLLVDNDKQGNLSRAMGLYRDSGICQTAQLLSGANINSIQIHTKESGLGLINANMSLLTITYKLASGREACATKRFEAIRQARAEDGEPYDYIIIDNPPDLGLNVVNALMVTDDVIIPTRIDQWALDGMETIMDQLKDIKKYNRGIGMVGVLITMYKHTPANIAGVEWLADHGYEVFAEKIRYSEKVAESTLMGKSLEEYSPRSAAAVSYRKFVKEYRRRMRKNEKHRNMLQR